MKLLCLLASLIALPVVAQIKVEEFIADNPPTASSHASTICDAAGSLMAAWFGGTKERARDCVIWLSRHEDRKWTKPVEVARGDEDGDEQWACWNPVLFQRKTGGDLWLFYKVGPSPSEWWGRFITSKDAGLTWSRSKRLPSYAIGPVRNKPVELADGTVLCGASTENRGWLVHMEWFTKPNERWRTSDPLNSAMQWGAIQPTILLWPDKRIQILCRSKQGSVLESWSEGNLREWSPMRRTGLPNPNSAIDAVMLRNGQALLAYNPSTDNRNQLVIGRSLDGLNWNTVLTLEKGPGEYSYPAIIQDRAGMVHVTYTWRREKIKHVVFDPLDLK
ncbi:MAG TPA: exo-alpha-sialidase [Verrucomicrobiota bacterium]|nr:sialidase [Verrucomicrobiales bacterium]HRI14515.1 exo-alpha-sialidase [Verrucomicrobiota bacterium]